MQNNFLEFGIRQNIKHAAAVLCAMENNFTGEFRCDIFFTAFSKKLIWKQTTVLQFVQCFSSVLSKLIDWLEFILEIRLLYLFYC